MELREKRLQGMVGISMERVSEDEMGGNGKKERRRVKLVQMEG